MKIKVHFEWPDGTEDSIIITGETFKEIKVKAHAEIKKRHKNKCVYCGEKKTLTMDHIIPVSKGGAHTKENVIPACRACNTRKKDNPVLLQILAETEVKCPNNNPILTRLSNSF